MEIKRLIGTQYTVKPYRAKVLIQNSDPDAVSDRYDATPIIIQTKGVSCMPSAVDSALIMESRNKSYAFLTDYIYKPIFPEGWFAFGNFETNNYGLFAENQFTIFASGTHNININLDTVDPESGEVSEVGVDFQMDKVAKTIKFATLESTFLMDQTAKTINIATKASSILIDETAKTITLTSVGGAKIEMKDDGSVMINGALEIKK